MSRTTGQTKHGNVVVSGELHFQPISMHQVIAEPHIWEH